MSNNRIYEIGELKLILKNWFKERIHLYRVKNSFNTIEGTLDSKKIRITYDSHFDSLLASTSLDSREILDELIPILTRSMNGHDPICSYDLLKKGDDPKNAMPTIEWDLRAPKARIDELVSSEGFAKYDALNLKIFNEKIFGIYPGNIKDVDKVNNLSEVNLYFAIDFLGGYIGKINHDAADGRIPEMDLEEEQYALEYLVYQTTKFGVDLPKPESGKHIIPTDSYWAWFRFYDNHFKHVLTEEQWDAFQEARSKGEDVSAFMPSENWADSLEDGDTKTKVNTNETNQ